MYRPLQFDKRSQYFIGTDDETLSVAMRVYDPDHSPFKIESRNPAQAPSGVVKIVGDDFPALHASCATDSRLLVLAEFLESGIAAQWVPDRIKPKKGRRNGPHVGCLYELGQS
jgi:hypothetical protein